MQRTQSSSRISNFLFTVSCHFDLVMYLEPNNKSNYKNKAHFQQVNSRIRLKAIISASYYTFNFLFYLGSSLWPFQVTMHKLKNPTSFIKWYKLQQLWEQLILLAFTEIFARPSSLNSPLGSLLLENVTKIRNSIKIYSASWHTCLKTKTYMKNKT